MVRVVGLRVRVIADAGGVMIFGHAPGKRVQDFGIGGQRGRIDPDPVVDVEYVLVHHHGCVVAEQGR
jgi:hypothetical protein